MIDAAKIKNGMPILASDGERVGNVDHVEGSTRLKVTRQDSGAHKDHHHFIPFEWISKVDEHVHLSKAGTDVKTHWEHS